MRDIGMILGALGIVFLLSRFALLMLSRLTPPELQIVSAHTLVLIFCVVAYGFGSANGGPPDFLKGLPTYWVASVFWLCVDCLRMLPSDKQ